MLSLNSEYDMAWANFAAINCVVCCYDALTVECAKNEAFLNTVHFRSVSVLGVNSYMF